MKNLVAVCAGHAKKEGAMIEILPESAGDVLGVKATAKLTDDDYRKVFIPALERMLKEYGKVKALFYMDPDFKGWDLRAMWDDAKFGVKHKDDFEKIAVVGGKKWIDWAVKLDALFMKGKVKTYSDAELAQAWDWIKS